MPLSSVQSGFLGALPHVVARFLAVVAIPTRCIFHAGYVPLGVLTSEPTPSYVHGDWSVIVASWCRCQIVGLSVTLVIHTVSSGWLAFPPLRAVPVVTAPVLVVLIVSSGASVHDVKVIMGVDRVNGFHHHFSKGGWSWGLEYISTDVEGESSQE
jgi:hypothetical protein